MWISTDANADADIWSTSSGDVEQIFPWCVLVWRQYLKRTDSSKCKHMNVSTGMRKSVSQGTLFFFFSFFFFFFFFCYDRLLTHSGPSAN